MAILPKRREYTCIFVLLLMLTFWERKPNISSMRQMFNFFCVIFEHTVFFCKCFVATVEHLSLFYFSPLSFMKQKQLFVRFSNILQWAFFPLFFVSVGIFFGSSYPIQVITITSSAICFSHPAKCKFWGRTLKRRWSWHFRSIYRDILRLDERGSVFCSEVVICWKCILKGSHFIVLR